MGIRIKGKMPKPQEAAATKRFKDFSYSYQTQELILVWGIIDCNLLVSSTVQNECWKGFLSVF